MAVVMVGVDDRFDGFLVEDVVQLGIEGILGGLRRRNALPWIDDNQAVDALDQCRVVPIVPSGNVDPIRYSDHCGWKERLILGQQRRMDRHRFRI